MTGMEAKAEWSLDECGLTSLGITQFTNALNAELSNRYRRKISLAVSDIMSAKDISEIASLLESLKRLG